VAIASRGLRCSGIGGPEERLEGMSRRMDVEWSTGMVAVVGAVVVDADDSEEDGDARD